MGLCPHPQAGSLLSGPECVSPLCPQCFIFHGHSRGANEEETEGQEAQKFLRVLHTRNPSSRTEGWGTFWWVCFNGVLGFVGKAVPVTA